MQSDCQIYVDPEEDEVFFGCVSEKERNIIEKLVKHAVPSLTDDGKLNANLDECVVNVDGDTEKSLENEQSIEINKEVMEATESAQPNELALENITDLSNTSNTSVEIEHNYSTPMKHKIDKSILQTPKSLVKADKDGGFLKILSEIALVKAEAEGDSNSESKREDEDKENKIVPTVPEIKITEATFEKGVYASPPKAISTELRRFRIIYNSPRNEENVNQKPKSNVESFESEKNLKNKRLDQEIEILGSNRRINSVDLIDLDSSVLPEKEENKNDCVAETKSVSDVITLTDSPDSSEKEEVKKEKNPRPPLRFSKEARKIVEVLKKSTFEDTLNFTIPEINVEEEEEEEEYSFLSPETGLMFDETVVAKKNPIQIQPNFASPKVQTERIELISKIEEKRTPLPSQPIKYFSERHIYNEIRGETERKCVKKLPLEDKRPANCEKVVKGMSHKVPSSRIPVFCGKNSKKPLFERVASPAGVKITPSKTPTVKTFKNSKFNHIESPINAYIHNKPTALVLNVKPDIKKETARKAWKTQSAGENGKKVQEKPTAKVENVNSAVKLPFVDYKSATPYKIEKRPESRLPRLAPKVYKLIGSNSPKVLRHEGRAYVNSRRKENTSENTIVAEPNEVSVVVSQPAQKSHTIK